MSPQVPLQLPFPEFAIFLADENFSLVTKGYFSISFPLTRLGGNDSIFITLERFLVFFIFFKIFPSGKMTVKQSLMNDNANKICYWYTYSLLSVYVSYGSVLPLAYWEVPGLRVSSFAFGSSGTGLSPGWNYCVVLFLSTTLHSLGASLNPGVEINADKLYAGGNPVMSENPFQGGVEIQLYP